MIAASGIPCVVLMELTDAPGVHCVGFSQQDAGQAITRHLLDQGHRRIAFVAAQLDPRTLQRAEGYRRCLKGAGLYDARLELLSPQPSSMRLGGELLEDLLRTPRRAVGEAGARMLLSLLRGDAVSRGSVDLGFELVVRGSTLPAAPTTAQALTGR